MYEHYLQAAVAEGGYRDIAPAQGDLVICSMTFPAMKHQRPLWKLIHVLETTPVQSSKTVRRSDIVNNASASIKMPPRICRAYQDYQTSNCGTFSDTSSPPRACTPVPLSSRPAPPATPYEAVSYVSGFQTRCSEHLCACDCPEYLQTACIPGYLRAS